MWDGKQKEHHKAISMEEYLNKRQKMQRETIDQNRAECYDTQIKELIQRR